MRGGTQPAGRRIPRHRRRGTAPGLSEAGEVIHRAEHDRTRQPPERVQVLGPDAHALSQAPCRLRLELSGAYSPPACIDDVSGHILTRVLRAHDSAEWIL